MEEGESLKEGIEKKQAQKKQLKACIELPKNG